MTTTHHYPPEPDAVRSEAAPHMWCIGTRRDMLAQDVRLVGAILRQNETDLADALLTWQAARDGNRSMWRRVARLQIERVRRWRGEYRAAFRRLVDHGRKG